MADWKMAASLAASRFAQTASAVKALSMKRAKQAADKTPSKGKARSVTYVNPMRDHNRHLRTKFGRRDELKMQRLLLDMSRKRYDKYLHLIKVGYPHADASYLAKHGWKYWKGNKQVPVVAKSLADMDFSSIEERVLGNG